MYMSKQTICCFLPLIFSYDVRRKYAQAQLNQ